VELETKIGQLFIYTAGKSAQVGHYERDFLRRYRPGGLIYPSGLTAHHTRQQIAHYLTDLQAANAALGLPGPMIVCVDHRGGDSSLLPPEKGGLEFPAPIAQAALTTRAEQAGEEIGAAIARDVLDVGYNLNLAPYADFLERGDIERFVFGNSMMGATPEVNAALSVGLIRGMQSEGMATTYCVFPGGYGSLARDPHHFVGVIDSDEQTLSARYYVAPRAAFAAGADAVMLSHFQFPALDPESRPATFSPPIIQDVLRHQMGFNGLIMTDSIRMNSAIEVAGSRGEAAVRALEAGADVILCASWEERAAVAEAVHNGRISESRLDEAVDRVLTLKAKLATHIPAARSGPDSIDRGRMAYWIGQSMTWVRRPSGWQPLNQMTNPRILALAAWSAWLDAVGDVCGDNVHTLRLPVANTREAIIEQEEAALLLSMTEGYDCVLFGTSTPTDLRLAQRLQSAGRNVWVAHAGRVFEVEHAPELPVTLLSYGHGPLACRKAVEVFAGLLEATGEIPVPLKTAALAPLQT
jgi:beta-N-acetylhexosaminidase